MQRVKAIVAHVALCALFALGLVLGVVHPALASTSSEMSDDGEDYGWLYRNGDTLYDLEDGTPCYVTVGGRWYKSCWDRGDRQACGMIYPDGTMYLCGCVAEVDLDAAIASGRPASPSSVTVGGWFEEAPPARNPRLICLAQTDPKSGQRYAPSYIKRVCIDAEFASDSQFHDADIIKFLDGTFEGFCNLEKADGLEYLPTSLALNMARMFAGCSKIEELDLAGFDTARCEDFTGMFDGCASLTTLCLGKGWTQEEARTKTGEGALATFPVAMRRDEDSTAFAQGEVIPDGAGTYRVVERTHIKQATVEFGEADYVRAVAGRETFTARYTGEELRPSVTVTMDGTSLSEGEDYLISFYDNIEVGMATVKLEGLGRCYGAVTLTFNIEDVSAYAFLYGNGTLCLKAGHGLPSAKQASTGEGPETSWRWYDYDDDAAGSQVPWAGDAGKVRRVVVAASFSAFAPATMAGWFAGCENLTGVEGLANVDASRAGSMAGLFRGCTKLGELDLSGLKTSCVADFSSLASGCSSLERLVLGDLDLTDAKTTADFFGGCVRLNEFVCDSGFRNAGLGEARLALPKEAYRTEPGYARVGAGAPVPDGAGAYRLRNLALQLCTVEMDKDTYTCTGKPIKPKMTVRLGKVTLREGADYTVAYESNIYPGSITPKATITGKGVFSGGLVVPFKIVSRVTQVGDRLVIKNRTGTFVVKVTKVSKDGKAAEVAVVSVDAQPAAKYLSLPSECTIGNVKVSVTTVSSKLTGNFRNVTSVVIGAKVTTIGSKAFSKATKVRTLVIKSARLKTVKNCLSGSKVTKVKTKVSLSNTKRRTYKRWFTSRSTVGKSVTYSYG